MKSHALLAWAARNGAKPGRTGPEGWVVQASPAWSRAHLEDERADVQMTLLDAFAAAAGVRLPPPVASDTHRWRFSRSGSHGAGALWNERLRLGACGDWLLGPRVESAWMSGTQLAVAMGTARHEDVR